jgi:hypothetical protein
MRALLVGLLLVVAGCASTLHGCTAVGALHGVAVTFDPAVGHVDALRLRVCTGSRCQTLRAVLFVGADGEPTGAMLRAELPAGPVRISGSYRVGQRRIGLVQVTSRAVTSYPNGKSCGADGTHVTLRLTAHGLVDGTSRG